MSADQSIASASREAEDFAARIGALVAEMTLAEKIGQMAQVDAVVDHTPEELREAVKKGRIGSVINQVDVDTVNQLQRLAVQESRLGVPLLFARDVIHGFKTVFPIPLGQAASWNPDIVEESARVAALEAASAGVCWTLAPPLDIARDPRWGRIAESLGEDPYLTSTLGAAMVRGLQGEDLSMPGSIAACAKHFAGYGASESGRDYNTANIPENELRNVYLPPFKAALDAGVATFMASFSELNGVPATGNEWLMKRILREEWGFEGFVVSDWESIRQLSVHGLTPDDRESALEAANAGIDMEMASTTYADHLPGLVEEGRISMEQVDTAVANILRLKFRLGLFDDPCTDPADYPAIANEAHLAVAKRAAKQSIVLLKNDGRVLPLSRDSLKSLAVIGFLADDPHEQLGTWTFDGDAQYSTTVLQAIRESVGDAVEVRYARGTETTRSRSREHFSEALAVAEKSDAVVLVLGEEAILSGEAHSRADITLPGNQAELTAELARTGKPLLLVIMAGRPLALSNVVDHVDALLYAWHPGSMAGPAIADLLWGIESPSGKLPVTFPRMTGQIPIYYAHKNTGRPPTPETFVHIDDIEEKAPQVAVGTTSFHLDAGYTPLFAFGHGLSYAEFRYADIVPSATRIRLGETLTICAELTNTGAVEAEEVAQLYVRDLVGNVTRPVKELKGFQRVRLEPGESRRVSFELHTDDLAFHDRRMRLVTEPGHFHAWIGGSSETTLRTQFEVVE